MAGRKGNRGQTVTHLGCILTSKQDVTTVLENSPRPQSSDAPLCLKGCREHEIALWLAVKPKQLTVRLTPFSIGTVLCCCIDKLTVGAWACGFSYCH